MESRYLNRSKKGLSQYINIKVSLEDAEAVRKTLIGRIKTLQRVVNEINEKLEWQYQRSKKPDVNDLSGVDMGNEDDGKK